jgi:hypothetical protein
MWNASPHEASTTPSAGPRARWRSLWQLGGRSVNGEMRRGRGMRPLQSMSRFGFEWKLHEVAVACSNLQVQARSKGLCQRA